MSLKTTDNIIKSFKILQEQSNEYSKYDGGGCDCTYSNIGTLQSLDKKKKVISKYFLKNINNNNKLRFTYNGKSYIGYRRLSNNGRYLNTIYLL